MSSELVTSVLADESRFGGPCLSSVNRNWIDQSPSFKTDFKDSAENVYKAQASEVDFQDKPDEVRVEVNSWAENKTNGHIKDLIPPDSKLLKDLGLVLPLSKGGFTNMVDSGGEDLEVIAVFYKSFIEVNEEATEAVAATAAILGSYWSTVEIFIRVEEAEQERGIFQIEGWMVGLNGSRTEATHLVCTHEYGRRGQAPIRDDESMSWIYRGAHLCPTLYVEVADEPVQDVGEGTSGGQYDGAGSSGVGGTNEDDDATEDDVHGNSDEEYVPSDESDDDYSDHDASLVVPSIFDDINDMEKSELHEDSDGITMWDGNWHTIRYGVHFANKKEVQTAVGEWTLRQGRACQVKYSRPYTWAAECETKGLKYPEELLHGTTCLWKCRATLQKDTNTWRMVVWIESHNCLGATTRNEGRNLTSTMIARLITANVRKDPGYSVAQIQVEVNKTYRVTPNYKKEWHGRRKALESLYGTWENNFQQLPSFQEALLKANPDTRMQFKFTKDTKNRKKKTNKLFQENIDEIDKCHSPLATNPMKRYDDYLIHQMGHEVTRFSKRNQKYQVVTYSPPDRPWKDGNIHEFVWMPYSPATLADIDPSCSVGSALWMSQTWLLYFGIREPHIPGRVLRQFGFLQWVPDNTFIMEKKEIEKLHKETRGKKCRDDVLQRWETRHNTLAGLQTDMTLEPQAEPEYLVWYQNRFSVTLVTNPSDYRQPQGFQGSAESLHIMANLVQNMRHITLDGLQRNPADSWNHNAFL
ncbi:OLC1v1005501C1 [Oldenlandia corymbosa var. corymbosa]|uniref:OLC1v1005501C1 n=1 Tax=Oldenlandia corymbosa var. corymbosa TaxID=529605 RepID=A0AAV1DHG0_OLDCO|nr:OLC1v1005501C1 [Oldenlandia corymbosa var. corymbosa]